jgi:hypothetical protein
MYAGTVTLRPEGARFPRWAGATISTGLSMSRFPARKDTS